MSTKFWIITLIILASGYGIYTIINNSSTSKSQEWSSKSLETLTSKCMEDPEGKMNRYPKLKKEYCECATQKIQTAFTTLEYIDITKTSVENQKEKLLPIFQICLAEFQVKLKSPDL